MADRKRDNIKHVVSKYLQKRNYSSLHAAVLSKKNYLTYSLVESEIARPNSLLLPIHDANSIDSDFRKFIKWLRDLQMQKLGSDIQNLAWPLFCHLFIYVSKNGQDNVTVVFQSLLDEIRDINCEDDAVKSLVNSFKINRGDSSLTEQFLSKKYVLHLTGESCELLRNFALKNWHITMRHIIQKWFHIEETKSDLDIDDHKESKESSRKEESKHKDKRKLNDNKLAYQDVLSDLKRLPTSLLSIGISNTKEEVTCAILKRKCLIAFAENISNKIRIRPMPQAYPILGCCSCKQLTLSGNCGRVYCLALTSDNKKIICAGESQAICIFDLLEGTLKRQCKGHNGVIYAVEICKNDQFIASASADKTARLWSLESGLCLRIFVGHSQAVTCVNFHPNCIYLATGSTDANVRLWSVENGNPMRLFTGSKAAVYGIAFNPRGQSIASACEDRQIHIHCLASSKVLHRIRLEDILYKLVWNKTGDELCAGGETVVKIWRISVKNNHEKLHEPHTIQLYSKLKALEFNFGTFAAVTSMK